LELEHDGHLLGIALAQARRYAHARGAREEGDEEMMVAGQAGARDLAQHLAHHPAQRVLGQNVVADVIVSHRGRFPESRRHGVIELRAPVNRL
jgi:hypothetical protein